MESYFFIIEYGIICHLLNAYLLRKGSEK